MRVKLTKLSDNPNALPTDVFEGHAPYEPEVDTRFVMTGKHPTKRGKTRVVTTSRIEDVERLDAALIKFRTQNSTYLFERLDVLS